MARYNHAQIEKKWQEFWEKNPINKKDDKKEKYYCLDMFPYPSGAGLHVGHWRGYVISDAWARYQIIKGKYVIHPMGWDAFGLPAENYAIKMGIHPSITTKKNVENIKQKLEATRTIALRDNNLLEQQFINNKDYVNQLEQLIIAGKFKAEELEEELKTMCTNGSDMIEINDTNNFKEALEKRVTDLVMLHHAFNQSLYQIRIIQQTNLQDANNTESQVLMLIPFWKNQLSLTVALYNQQQSIKAKQAVYDAINKSLVSNSEMMKTQSIEVAKQNQRTVLDAETLMKTTRDLIETIQGVQKVQEEGKKKRMDAEAKIIECEKQMTQAINGLTNNNERIVSRELIGNEN